MARRSSTINKTRVREEIAILKQRLAELEMEVARLDVVHNPHHKMRLQSILGAGIILDIQQATKELNKGFRGVRSITRREIHEFEHTDC
jgi:hypothetical protein